MCQIDFVMSFIWFQYKTVPVHTTFRVCCSWSLPGSRRPAVSKSAAEHPIPSHPVPSLPSHPIPSRPVHFRVHRLCCSLGRRCPPTCPSSAQAAHLGLRESDSHLQTETSKMAKPYRLCQYQLLLPSSPGISVKLLIDSIPATSLLFFPFGRWGMWEEPTCPQSSSSPLEEPEGEPEAVAGKPELLWEPS